MKTLILFIFAWFLTSCEPAFTKVEVKDSADFNKKDSFALGKVDPNPKPEKLHGWDSVNWARIKSRITNRSHGVYPAKY